MALFVEARREKGQLNQLNSIPPKTAIQMCLGHL
jgi:hypothetical protein